jgi:large subunit ribosomal protein L29
VKPVEVRDLTDLELATKLLDLKKELFALRFQHAVNQLENPKRLSFVKKDIARVKTVIREREMKKEGA